MDKQQWIKENPVWIKSQLEKSPLLQINLAQYLYDLQASLNHLQQIDVDRWKQKALMTFTDPNRTSWPIAQEWRIREIIFDIDGDVTVIMKHPHVDYFKSPNIRFSYEDLFSLVPEI